MGVSHGGLLFVCGEAVRSLRLADRNGAPRGLRDERKRSVIRGGGAAVDRVVGAPGHQHYGLFFEAKQRPPSPIESIVVRTRDDAWGTPSWVGAGGGAVALMVLLLSGYPTLPECAPLSSYRYGNKVLL